jgi:hypothetical protein
MIEKRGKRQGDKMEVKEAVKKAQDWVSALLAEEGVSNIGLEKVTWTTSRSIRD